MKKAIKVIGVLLLAGVIGLAVFNYQGLKDQYHARTVALSPEVDAIYNNLQLTPQGGVLFKASRPEILSAESFNAACHQVSKEFTIVLGCYTAQRFYIYDVNDSRLKGIQEVTAAHELLHAVYERLSQKEKDLLGPLLKKTAKAMKDERFQETIATYQTAEPGHIENELHSILGTEVAVLPKELEDHYARYFKDRSAVVAYAAAYEATFTEIEDQIRSYDAKLATYTTQKEQLEAFLATQQNTLDTQRQDMESLRAAGNLEEYNAQVSEFNQRVQHYNQNIATLQSVVANYNALVEKRNSLVVSQQELLQHMDSTYTPLE